MIKIRESANRSKGTIRQKTQLNHKFEVSPLQNEIQFLNDNKSDSKKGVICISLSEKMWPEWP